MRLFLALTPLCFACSDAPGEPQCPWNRFDAIGTSCAAVGQQCGDVPDCSLCPPPAGCWYIECQGATWVRVDVPLTCTDAE